MRVIVLVLAALCAVPAVADCPFNIPVVTIAPHSVNGFSWGNVVRPMNDACIEHIEVDPTSSAAWYVGGLNGLYQTKNGGLTWTKPLQGHVRNVLLVRDQPHLVYATIGNRLFLTRDSGTTWTQIQTFPKTIASLHVSGSTLYVGPFGDDHVTDSGIWVCSLGCGLPLYKKFNNNATGVIVWSINRDPVTGTLYAGGEIFDHPAPYDPPFFKSNDGGNTWTDISAALPWHVVRTAVRPADGYLYALLEGSGVYGTPNQGATWFAPSNSLGLGVALLMDPLNNSRLYAGRQKYGTLNGGIYMSTNAGISFTFGGLAGATVADIDISGANTRMYAVVYASGIYMSPRP